jgi:hypothetical protein
MTSSRDPLDLAGLDPGNISKTIDEKKGGKAKLPTELEVKKEERLASKESRMAKQISTHAPAGKGGQTVEAPPPPEVYDKSYLLDRLGAYRERFPHLKKRNNVTAKSGVEDILDELHYCEVQLGSKQDGSMGCTLLHGTMIGVESFTRDVWNPMGLRLTGLGQITKDNMSEFEPIVDELMIKYGAGMYMSVEMRLAIAIGATVLTVHGANSGDPRIAAALEKMNRNVVLPESGKDL